MSDPKVQVGSVESESIWDDRCLTVNDVLFLATIGFKNQISALPPSLTPLDGRRSRFHIVLIDAMIWLMH